MAKFNVGDRVLVNEDPFDGNAGIDGVDSWPFEAVVFRVDPVSSAYTYRVSGSGGRHWYVTEAMLAPYDADADPAHDPVNHPSHYTSHPSGIECIQVTRHHNFNTGNAIKYLWRAGLKDSDAHVQDLEKAIFYIKDEIARLTHAETTTKE